MTTEAGSPVKLEITTRPTSEKVGQIGDPTRSMREALGSGPLAVTSEIKKVAAGSPEKSAQPVAAEAKAATTTTEAPAKAETTDKPKQTVAEEFKSRQGDAMSKAHKEFKAANPDLKYDATSGLPTEAADFDRYMTEYTQKSAESSKAIVSDMLRADMAKNKDPSPNPETDPVKFREWADRFAARQKSFDQAVKELPTVMNGVKSSELRGSVKMTSRAETVVPPSSETPTTDAAATPAAESGDKPKEEEKTDMRAAIILALQYSIAAEPRQNEILDKVKELDQKSPGFKDKFMIAQLAIATVSSLVAGPLAQAAAGGQK